MIVSEYKDLQDLLIEFRTNVSACYDAGYTQERARALSGLATGTFIDLCKKPLEKLNIQASTKARIQDFNKKAVQAGVRSMQIEPSKEIRSIRTKSSPRPKVEVTQAERRPQEPQEAVIPEQPKFPERKASPDLNLDPDKEIPRRPPMKSEEELADKTVGDLTPEDLAFFKLLNQTVKNKPDNCSIIINFK